MFRQNWIRDRMIRPMSVGFVVASIAVGGQFADTSYAQAPVAAVPQFTTSSIADIVDQARPAVVFIAVRTAAPAPTRGRNPSQQPGQSGQGGQSVGSGAILNQDGFIVTNNHVVEDAAQIRVVLTDGRTYDAKLIGRDPPSDLAVIKIDPKSGEQLPTLSFGDSAKLRVGEWVVAIGNALGLEGGPTVTAGVVSALGRDVAEPNGAILENVVQTDTAINPGNSGGPLLNMAGQIVGINTLGAGQTGNGYQAQGINFAISTSTARPIVDDLIASGKVTRAYMGVASTTFTQAIAAEIEQPFRPGSIVAQVGAGTPAAKAGIREQDIIVNLGQLAITSDRELRAAILARKPGETVAVQIIRKGQPVTVQVQLMERPTA